MGATFLKHPVHLRNLFSRATFASQIVRDYLKPFKCYKALKLSRDPKIVHQTPRSLDRVEDMSGTGLGH